MPRAAAPSLAIPALSATPARQGFFEMPHGRVSYRLEGSGPVVTLTHGYGANLHMWAMQREALGRHFTLLSWDCPGFGQSCPLPGQPHMRDFVRVKAALMDHLGIGEAHVAGLSMGGMVVMAFAEQFPDRVRSLLLCDTAAAPLPPVGKFLFRLYQLRGEMGDESLDWRGRLENLDDHADLTRWGLSAEERFAHLVMLTHHAHPGGTARAAAAVASKPDQTPVVAGFRKPVLVAVGTEDLLFAHALDTHRHAPLGRLVVFENVNHGTAVIHPHGFNRTVLDFLQDVETGGFTPGSFFLPQGFPPPPLLAQPVEELRRYGKSFHLWQALPDVLDRLTWALFR